MKYVVCNLKTHLNDFNINDYLETIKKIAYKNVIFCIPNNYIKLFKGYKICTQDYYDNIKEEYALIGHFEKNDTKEEIKEKINKAHSNNIKVILCVGNNDIKNYEEIKNQLDYYLDESKNIIIAYEPYNMINTNNNIKIEDIDNIVKKIKKDYDNIPVLYGGNVNKSNIERIIKITDGVLMGRFSFNPHKVTYFVNNIKKIL